MRRDLNLYRKSMEPVIVVYTLMIYCALYQPVFKIYMEHRKSINCCDRVVPELGNSAIPLADLVLTDRGITNAGETAPLALKIGKGRKKLARERRGKERRKEEKEGERWEKGRKREKKEEWERKGRKEKGKGKGREGEKGEREENTILTKI